MAHYILKTYDPKGRLVGRFEFPAPNDHEAEAAVRELPSERSRELWCGQRWVCSWPPDSAQGRSFTILSELAGGQINGVRVLYRQDGGVAHRRLGAPRIR